MTDYKELKKEFEAGIRCPSCFGTDLESRDCGPDGYDDDIVYTSFKCKLCGLWFDGWRNRWLLDCDSWHDEEDAREFPLKEMLIELTEQQSKTKREAEEIEKKFSDRLEEERSSGELEGFDELVQDIIYKTLSIYTDKNTPDFIKDSCLEELSTEFEQDYIKMLIKESKFFAPYLSQSTEPKEEVKND